MLYRGLYKSINDFFILKLYFLFGGMKVHIDLCWIKINKKHIHGETVLGDDFLVSIHPRVVQVSTTNKPVVDKKILPPPRFPGCLPFTHETIDIHVISSFFNRDQSCVIRTAK